MAEAKWWGIGSGSRRMLEGLEVGLVVVVVEVEVQAGEVAVVLLVSWGGRYTRGRALLTTVGPGAGRTWILNVGVVIFGDGVRGKLERTLEDGRSVVWDYGGFQFKEKVGKR